jgi:uncharacterized membrane protein YozB (DUF420 family)
MAHATIPAPAGTGTLTGRAKHSAITLALTGVLVLAAAFVLKYVFHYYLNYDQASFEPYWTRRAGLLLHITGGMLALLSGPWQFWTGLRQKHLPIHRWTGRLFLLGVAMGATGALYLGFTTTIGWAFGAGLVALALAWATTSAMALYFILQGQVQIHKEWMIRAYVVTYAFVTFRVFSDYGPVSRLQPRTDVLVTMAWASWVVPLFIAEVVLQFRRAARSTLAARQ